MIKMVMHNRVKYRTKSYGERARQQRDREGERQSIVMVWAINLIIRENIYGRCGRIIRDDQDAS
jgi:hypothetical protein